MINTYTMSERRQEKLPVQIAVAASNLASATAFPEHTLQTSLVTDSGSFYVQAGPYTHIKVYPVLSAVATTVIRVTGWSQIKDTTTYIPTLLFAGNVATVQTATAVQISSTNLKFVNGITASYTTTSALINNAGITSAASIIVPQFGCSVIEFDIQAGSATSGNFYYSYCSI